MAEELQSLLNKINQEGVKKAEAESSRIIENAEKKAREIIQQAQSEADSLRQTADRDAAGLQKRAASAVEQASRDVLLKLKSEMEKRLRNIVAQATGEALTPSFMAEVIKQLLVAFDANPESELTVLTAVKDVEKLQKSLMASLGSSFKSAPEVFPDMELKNGCKVNISGSEVYYDLSDSAVTELVSAFIGPKLAEMLKK